MLLILSTIVASALNVGQARETIIFSDHTYRVLGTLRDTPLRVIVWEGTPRKLEVRVTPGRAGCKECPALVGLPVEAQVRMKKGTKAEGELVSIRARAFSLDLFGTSKALDKN